MRVLLGVSGGIAAYKAANIVRTLVKRGDEVRVVMTRSAAEFITPMTLQVVSGHPVGQTLWDLSFESEIGHIELARWADVILVAPATAHLIARAAHGMADDLLTTILLATTSPVVVAPAMNTQMLLHPAVQDNLATLGRRGVLVVDPDAGELACKEVGPGRLPDAPVLVDAILKATSPRLLQGRRVLVTAGPTREAIDPARFISNPSSGRMGYAIAAAAWQAGAEAVTLVSGPTELEAPLGVHRISVQSAQQMHDAVWAEVRGSGADLIVKAAAVADWRPAGPSAQKRPKSEIAGSLTLERTPDILASLGEAFGPEGEARTPPGGDARPLLVGFAAESHDVVERGRAKMLRKNAHVLVANRIGGPDSAFGATASSAWILHHPSVGGEDVPLPHADKAVLARAVVQAAAAALDR